MNYLVLPLSAVAPGPFKLGLFLNGVIGHAIFVGLPIAWFARRTASYRYELLQLGIDVVLVQPSAYPTNMYAAAQKPRDAEGATAYGEIGAIPGKMFETFMGIFTSPGAPNPHDVAEAAAKLIATPKGQRPERVVVGQAFGSDAVNSAVAPIQRQVVEGLGLSVLAAVEG